MAAATSWALRANPDAAVPAASLVPAGFQGELFCNRLQCVVIAENSSDISLVSSLADDPRVELESLPDAHKIYFAKSTFDIETGAFERPFAGSSEVSAGSPISLFVVVFKGFPQQAWLDDLSRAGLSVLEPLPPMGYQVYGSRATLADIIARKNYIYRFADIPAGVGRFGIDEKVSAAFDTSLGTTVVAVAEMALLVKERLRTLTGREPSEVDDNGPHLALQAELTNAQAIALSRMPEVVAVHRNSFETAPSDERFNRIVGGTFQTPGSAWPATGSLGTNTSPYKWDSFISSLASLQPFGISTARETIGFLDTGIDDGLYDVTDGSSRCPPHLGSPCNLVFLTDVTNAFPDIKTRGDDRVEHGSVSSAIAAGITSGSVPRDAHGWAFTQGVAPGAKVAMSKNFDKCFEVLRSDSYGNPLLGIVAMNYSLAELGTMSALPDFPSGTNGPGVRLYNHSWNEDYKGEDDPSQYGPEAALIDRATRLLSSAKITLGTSFTEVTGASVGALHVVSAGNFPGPYGTEPSPRVVTTPGNAKNVITVGATSSLNDESYSVGSPCSYNTSDHASDARRIEDFSRYGWPNQRLKPDLVAPGTRAYGIRSARLNTTCVPVHQDDPFSGCNFDLEQNGEIAWWAGTSFAAPVVSGAAALVHDWFRVLTNNQSTNASPALVKAALIASATNLRDSVFPMRLIQDSGDFTQLTPSLIDPVTLTPDDTFEIAIDGQGNPDTFVWLKNSVVMGSHVPIVVGVMPLGNQGFAVEFTATTGHSLTSWAVRYGCAEVKPAPDRYQGWGGVSFDRLFQAADHYYWQDEGTPLYAFEPLEGPLVWTKSLTIDDPEAPVTVALVWTDRASVTTVSSGLNLVNDLDLRVDLTPGVDQYLKGNNYYYGTCDPERDGYSLYRPDPNWIGPDRKNNVERVDVSADIIGQANGGQGATGLTITVSAFAVRGDGMAPTCGFRPPGLPCVQRQDFAVFVVNAHE